LVFSPLFAFSQKAFDAFYHCRQTQNFTAILPLANGYIGACEIKSTDNKTKKNPPSTRKMAL